MYRSVVVTVHDDDCNHTSVIITLLLLYIFCTIVHSNIISDSYDKIESVACLTEVSDMNQQ